MKDDRIKIFSAQVKRIRAHKDLTTYELADRAGLTQAYISRVENNQARKVSLDTVIRLSNALETPVAVLIGEAKDDALGVEIQNLVKKWMETTSSADQKNVNNRIPKEEVPKTRRRRKPAA